MAGHLGATGVVPEEAEAVPFPVEVPVPVPVLVPVDETEESESDWVPVEVPVPVAVLLMEVAGDMPPAVLRPPEDVTVEPSAESSGCVGFS